MVVTKKEAAKWNGFDTIVLTADWAIDILKSMTDDGKRPWPAAMPKQCRLYLDAKTYWPHRIEWLGSVPGKSENGVILQMEFRSPKHEVFSLEVCKREFSFDPGKGKLPNQVDQTEDLKERLRYRNQQLAAERGKSATTK